MQIEVKVTTSDGTTYELNDVTLLSVLVRDVPVVAMGDTYYPDLKLIVNDGVSAVHLVEADGDSDESPRGWTQRSHAELGQQIYDASIKGS